MCDGPWTSNRSRTYTIKITMHSYARSTSPCPAPRALCSRGSLSGRVSVRAHPTRCRVGRSFRLLVGLRGVRQYYALSARSVARASDLVGGVRRNAPDPIPCTLLGQLAVDARYQGKSAGARLLQDAIKRAARASMVVASRALIVDPSDERAEGFYQHFGFRCLSDSSRRMFLSRQ